MFWARIGSNFVLAVQLPFLRSYSKTLNCLWFFPLAVCAGEFTVYKKSRRDRNDPLIKLKTCSFSIH